MSSNAAMSLDLSSVPAAYETYQSALLSAIHVCNFGDGERTNGSLHIAGRLKDPSVELLSMAVILKLFEDRRRVRSCQSD
jgi:hypothetical protein